MGTLVLEQHGEQCPRPRNVDFLQNALCKQLGRDAVVSSGILTLSVDMSVGTREVTRSARLPQQSATPGPLQQQTCVSHGVGGCKSEIRVPAWPGSAEELVLDWRWPSSPVPERDSELWRLSLLQGHQSHAGAPCDLIEPSSPAKAHLQPPSQGVRAPALEGAPLRPLWEVTVGRPRGTLSLGGGVVHRRSRQHRLRPEEEAAGVGRLEGALQRAQRLHVWRAVSRTWSKPALRLWLAGSEPLGAKGRAACQSLDPSRDRLSRGEGPRGVPGRSSEAAEGLVAPAPPSA